MTAALIATQVTAAATPFVALGALWAFRLLTASRNVGRHRLGTGPAYRPRPAAQIAAGKGARPAPAVPVIPGPDPLTEQEKRGRMVAVPLVRQQAPLTDAVTQRLMNTLVADIEAAQALDEKTLEVARIS